MKICVTTISDIITTKSDPYTFDRDQMIHFAVRKEEVQIFSLRLIVAFTAHSPSSLAPCRIVSDL